MINRRTFLKISLLSILCHKELLASLQEKEEIKIPHSNEFLSEKDLLMLCGKKSPDGLCEVGKNTNILSQYSETFPKYLVEDATNAFCEMRHAAAKNGIHIVLADAYRSYDAQKKLWNKRMSVYGSIDKTLEYVALPGTSAHHWGTDIDIRAAKNRFLPKSILEMEKNPEFKDLHCWMRENAHRFNYVLLLPDDWKTRGGTKFEPWHYSYKPLHQRNRKNYLANLEEIFDILVSDKAIFSSKIQGKNTKEYLREYAKNYFKKVNKVLL